MPDNSQNDLKVAYFQNKKSSSDLGYNLEEEKNRIALATEGIKKELTEKWKMLYTNAKIFPEKIAAMHPDVVDYLLNFSLVATYDDIAKQANLDQQQRNRLPSVVWNLAQTKNWIELENILERDVVQGPQSQVLAQLLEKNILSSIKNISTKPAMRREVLDAVPKTKIVMLTLDDAMQKYPKIGEQLVSSNALKLRIFPTPVRPSIKNWITDYHDFSGSGKRSAVDRGNYLFQSVNGKKLTTAERQKVSDMLKALDQNENVSIDIEKELIVFPSAENIIQRPVSTGKNDNVYVTSVRSSSGPSFQAPPQPVAPAPSTQPQEDVFDRYSKKSFSPNFADKNEFIVKKRSEAPDSVEEFRKANIASTEDQQVMHGSADFHEFSSDRKDENGIDGELSFSAPQKFSTERKEEIQPQVYRQSWQRAQTPLENDNDGADLKNDQ